jgi:hypothetical protein
VLVLDNIHDPSALLPLTQLEYLHLDECRHSADGIQLASVLRHLSSVHALRSLSLDYSLSSHSGFRWLCVLLAMTPALRPRLLKRCTAADVKASATGGRFGGPVNVIPPLADYVDESRPSRLTEIRFDDSGYLEVWQAETLLLLPSLTRLHSGTLTSFNRLAQNRTLPSDALANMQQLSLTLVPHKPDNLDKGIFDLSHLFACRQLRVLQLKHETEAVSLQTLLCLLQNNAATGGASFLRAHTVARRFSIRSRSGNRSWLCRIRCTGPHAAAGRSIRTMCPTARSGTAAVSRTHDRTQPCTCTTNIPDALQSQFPFHCGDTESALYAHVG